MGRFSFAADKRQNLAKEELANPSAISQLKVEADNITNAVGRLALLPKGKERNQSSIKIVRRGISLLKTADLLFGEDAASVREFSIRLTTTLSKIHFLEEEPAVSRLGDILNHYRAKWLADDKELAANFEQYRADYLRNPNDGDIAIRYGWLLHDCLQAAYKRLLNVQLTEFFLNQFEVWKYSGEANEGISKLLAARKKDIESAKDFLSSPVDAQRLYNDKEWEKAIVACEFFLASHPDNATAWRIRARARYNLLAEAKKNSDSSQLADQTALFLEAASDFATHVPSSEEAAKLVLDAASERYWTLAKVAKNPPVNAAQKVTFLCDSLIKAFTSLSQVFARLVSDETDKRIQRRCVDMATRMVEAIYWEATRHPKKNANKEEYTGISISFASLIHLWGLDSLEDEDRDWYAKGGMARPLAARIVLALLAGASLGDTPQTVQANPWLLQFCESESKLFSRDPTSYCSRIAKVLLKLGDLERARSFALQVVRQNQTERWRWRLLADTYPDNSQEKADCLVASDKEGMRLSLTFEQLFDSTITQEKKDEQAGKIEEQAARASSLLVQNEEVKPGIIVSCFTEGKRGSNRDVTFDHKKYLRVWWRDDDGRPCFDFVPMEPSQDLDNLATGAPVLVTISESLGKPKAVKVSLREEGTPFDIYPYLMGVVIARNESRHYLKIAYGRGKSCGIDTKKFLLGNELNDGSLCEVALFEREGMAPLVLDVRLAKAGSSLPPFAKRFTGVLARERGSRNANVDDVAVDADKFSVGMLGKTVKGIAVSSRDKDFQHQWRAASCVVE